jgi:hypothetical protein
MKVLSRSYVTSPTARQIAAVSRGAAIPDVSRDGMYANELQTRVF